MLRFFGNVSKRTKWGWITQNGLHLYAWKSGQLIAEAHDPEDDWGMLSLMKTLGQTDGDPSGYAREYMSGRSEFWDDEGNLYVLVFTRKASYVCKLPWQDDDAKPLSPPAQAVRLDGYGYPLRAERKPPSIEVPQPTNLNGQETPQGTGPQLTFLYSPQDMRVENALYPVYSLWDYELSRYQQANPGAILGRVVRPSGIARQSHVPDFAPPIQIDLRDLASRKSILVSITGPEGRIYEVPYVRDVSTGACFWTDKYRKADIVGIDLRDFTTTDYECAPAYPEVLHGFIPSFPGITRGTESTTLIETGDDTKVFAAPRVMTRMWLKPKLWPSSEKASILVYSRNWANDRQSTNTLVETLPRSGRFVSSDGEVVYEFTHVMNSKKQLVPATMPDDVNYLYMYITDPALGLSHSPQMIFENGENTGEYWSFAEPPKSLVNPGRYRPYGYKPWTQVSKELEDVKFTVEVTGLASPGSYSLEVSWDDPAGKRQRAVVPLHASGEGKLKTTVPLLAFSAKGCDIGGTWYWTENVPTPELPGVVTFRDKNVRFAIVPAGAP